MSLFLKWLYNHISRQKCTLHIIIIIPAFTFIYYIKQPPTQYFNNIKYHIKRKPQKLYAFDAYNILCRKIYPYLKIKRIIIESMNL